MGHTSDFFSTCLLTKKVHHLQVLTLMEAFVWIQWNTPLGILHWGECERAKSCLVSRARLPQGWSYLLKGAWIFATDTGSHQSLSDPSALGKRKSVGLKPDAYWQHTTCINRSLILGRRAARGDSTVSAFGSKNSWGHGDWAPHTVILQSSSIALTNSLNFLRHE